jgi:hypothetical protein
MTKLIDSNYTNLEIQVTGHMAGVLQGLKRSQPRPGDILVFVSEYGPTTELYIVERKQTGVPDYFIARDSLGQKGPVPLNEKCVTARKGSAEWKILLDFFIQEYASWKVSVSKDLMETDNLLNKIISKY